MIEECYILEGPLGYGGIASVDRWVRYSIGTTVLSPEICVKWKGCEAWVGCNL